MRRVLSASVLILVLGVTVWILPPWATLVLGAIAAAFAAAELAGFGQAQDAGLPAVYVAAAAATVAAAFALLDDTRIISHPALFVSALTALIIISGAVALALGPPTPAALTRAALLQMAPIYVGVPLGAIIWVRTAFGPAMATWLVVVLAASDSAQYYTGRALGRRKLAPTVSPGKTIEGAVGGLCVAALAGAALAHWCIPFWSAPMTGLLALALAVAGMLGDLFESLLKRSAGLKDSSTLIPGHGGVLDRIDSYLFAGPVFYLCLRYLA